MGTSSQSFVAFQSFGPEYGPKLSPGARRRLQGGAPGPPLTRRRFAGSSPAAARARRRPLAARPRTPSLRNTLGRLADALERRAFADARLADDDAHAHAHVLDAASPVRALPEPAPGATTAPLPGGAPACAQHAPSRRVDNDMPAAGGGDRKRTRCALLAARFSPRVSHTAGSRRAFSPRVSHRAWPRAFLTVRVLEYCHARLALCGFAVRLRDMTHWLARGLVCFNGH